MKRKEAPDVNGHAHTSRKLARPTSSSVEDDFAPSLFDDSVLKAHSEGYRTSTTYRHAVVQPLISDGLLRAVREEIIQNIHFTTKETDIYRIFQSGDLANLDGLPESALARLPSLLRLRDALYSPQFRSWISTVSGAGPVSGEKTDMAINVYKPGCHLLCHDDVIGSRRVSYILYLTNPDVPWKAEWGGALRLYPTTEQTSMDGRQVKIPDPAWSKVIPPAWNQLSFFAVQPGESFHDVEEVYHKDAQDTNDDAGRVRMAISGWYHIPQEGEEGYQEGLEEKLAERSSLQQLQARDDALDRPPKVLLDRLHGGDQIQDTEDEGLSQSDLDFLLKYIAPTYLTPDTVEELNEMFAEESSLQLANILSPKILTDLESELISMENLDEKDPSWEIASPPHKHRYMYRLHQADAASDDQGSILGKILNQLLPSAPFHKWLSLVTGLSLADTSLLARRFRRGLDYTLATAHEHSDMQLEWCINITPTKGWVAESLEDGEEENAGGPVKEENADVDDADNNFGGYELYMAGDDADDDDDQGSDHGVEIPANAGQQASSSTTGGGHRRVLKTRATDPAVYKASGEDEDDGILFTNPASWNTMSIVLRDKGTLKFVKYVSKNAPGDRWDVVGSATVVDDGSDAEDNDEDDDQDGNGDDDAPAA